jgi:phage repressor protein C with HTH and peptisase S24 domain
VGNDFVSRLRELIGDGSVNSFAKRCGLNTSLVQQYLNGSTPSLEKAALIAEVCGVSLEWLASGRGHKEAQRDPTIIEPASVESFVKTLDEMMQSLSFNEQFARMGKELELPSVLQRLMSEAEALKFEPPANRKRQQKKQQTHSPPLRLARIPIYDAKFSAGAGVELFDEPTTQFTLLPASYLDAWGVASRDLAGVSAIGDSMTPTIGDGDLVIIDRRSADILSDRIYAFRLNGELRMKRLARLPNNGVRMVSDNKAYPPIDLTADEAEDFKLFGRVISVLKKSL